MTLNVLLLFHLYKMRLQEFVESTNTLEMSHLSIREPFARFPKPQLFRSACTALTKTHAHARLEHKFEAERTLLSSTSGSWISAMGHRQHMWKWYQLSFWLKNKISNGSVLIMTLLILNASIQTAEKKGFECDNLKVFNFPRSRQ